MSLKGYEDLRWQMFLGYIMILVTNIIMIIPLFLGYLRYGTLPYLTINKYVEKVDENEVIDDFLN